jgi:NTP pyrophosphatase (non-canonical NTP hydrolase)
MSRTLAELSDAVEAVSVRYARVAAITRDRDWFLLKLQEEVGELTAEALRATGRGRVDGLTPERIRTRLADEAADVLGQLLLVARHYDIDLEAALKRKWLRYLPDADAAETR